MIDDETSCPVAIIDDVNVLSKGFGPTDPSDCITSCSHHSQKVSLVPNASWNGASFGAVACVLSGSISTDGSLSIDFMYTPKPL